MNKTIEDLPFKEPVGKEYKSWWVGRHNQHRTKYWQQVTRLVYGYEGRLFEDLAKKALPLLVDESKPMSALLKYWFGERGNHSIVEGLVTRNKAEKVNYLPKGSFEHNGKFYLSTEESIVGFVLKLRKYKRTYWGNEDTWIESPDNYMKYSDFIDRYVRNHRNYKLNGVFNDIEAAHFLNPNNCAYLPVGNKLIDISKCLCFDDKKSLQKYIKRVNWEKRNENRKALREAEKKKLEESNQLLGVAMEKFQLRKAKEIELRKQKQLEEEKKSLEIAKRHGFDEDSFRGQQNRVK